MSLPSDYQNRFVEGMEHGMWYARFEARRNMNTALWLLALILSGATSYIGLQGFSNMGGVEFMRVGGSLVLSLAPALLGEVFLRRRTGDQ